MAIITEDYVSFETAKLLKEKGFMEGAIVKFFASGYDSKGNILDIRDTELKDYPRPTLQMAMKWLREVHHVYLNINVRVILGQWSGYDISIHTTDNDGFLNKKIPIVLKDNTSYEQACEAAIKYYLENFILK